MERDVEALLNDKPLPEESDAFLTAWKVDSALRPGAQPEQPPCLACTSLTSRKLYAHHSPPYTRTALYQEAQREAIKSEYAFRTGYNVYSQSQPSVDWQGIAEESFR